MTSCADDRCWPLSGELRYREPPPGRRKLSANRAPVVWASPVEKHSRAHMTRFVKATLQAVIKRTRMPTSH